MGKQTADQDNYTVDTDPSYELVLNRQSTGDYSNCSTITFEMLGFKTSILDNMRGYNQYGEDYKREEPKALPYSTSHIKSTMDSELSGLEISTPVMGNRQKVGATSEMEGLNMPFDPHDDTSVLEEELDLLGDDGIAYEVLEQEVPSEDMLPKSSSSTLPPPPAPPAQMETPTMGNARKLPVTSSHTFASEVVSDASFVVEELELADEEDEFTWKTISTKNMQYFLDAAKQYGDNVVTNESTDRTDRQSNRTSDVKIDHAARGMLEDEIYGDAAVSSGLGEEAKQKSLDEAIKEEDESKTLKKKKSSRKLKKDSSSRSKRLVCADTEAVGDISSPKSLKKKSSSRKLLKKASSKKLKIEKEPSSKKLKKEKSSNGLKKEPSSRSKKLADSQDADSSRTVQKSNSRTSKLLKSKSSSKRSSRKKLLAVDDGEDSSKKSNSNLRDKLLRKGSSKRRKKKQKLTEEDAASPSSSRPTLKKKKSKSSRRKMEDNSGASSRRSSFTQTATRRLSNLIRVSFTKDQ